MRGAAPDLIETYEFVHPKNCAETLPFPSKPGQYTGGTQGPLNTRSALRQEAEESGAMSARAAFVRFSFTAPCKTF